MTQQALANKVGAGRVTINRIERGTQTPTLDVACPIADALGATLDQLFSDEPGELPHEAFQRGHAAGVRMAKRRDKTQDVNEAYGRGFDAGRRAARQDLEGERGRLRIEQQRLARIETDTGAAS